MRIQRTIPILIILSTLLTITIKAEDAGARTRWYVGTWDSTINNLMVHPKTVALRIEVVDKETREPIPNAEISFEGEYWITPRTSRHPEGEREAQEMEYKLACQTDSHGIAVGAFGWQKEYPWSLGTDEIEKAQRIEVRHSRYKYVELRTPFYRFLDVGQKRTKPYPTNEDTYQPIPVIERFEKTWPLECAKRDVKFFVLDLGTDYKGFDKKDSTRPEFFEKIRDKEWSVVFEKPKNLMKWGMGEGRSWCGPYFVYLIEIRMERLRSQREFSDGNTFESANSRQKHKDNKKEIKNLNEILALHAKWLESNGSEGERANLVGMDFSFAQLRGINLKKATLQMTKFGGADLRNATFYGADLTGASFEGADLSVAMIAYANLYGADLKKAKLVALNAHFANLKVADLSGADLRGAIFYGANLELANLTGTKLGSRANGDRTDFRKAKLTGANLPANFYEE